MTVIISTTAYSDNSVYKEFVDYSSDHFLIFCKIVACGSPSTVIYKDWVKLVKQIFNKYDEILGLNVINAECNVNWLISQIFQELPSAKDHIDALNKCKDSNKFKNYQTIILYSQDLKNMKMLEKLLLQYTEDKYYNCRQPSCSRKVFSKKITKLLYIRGNRSSWDGNPQIYQGKHFTLNIY